MPADIGSVTRPVVFARGSNEQKKREGGEEKSHYKSVIRCRRTAAFVSQSRHFRCHRIQNLPSNVSSKKRDLNIISLPDFYENRVTLATIKNHFSLLVPLSLPRKKKKKYRDNRYDPTMSYNGVAPVRAIIDRECIAFSRTKKKWRKCEKWTSHARMLVFQNTRRSIAVYFAEKNERRPRGYDKKNASKITQSINCCN